MVEETNNLAKSEVKSKGVTLEKGVEITNKSNIDALSSRGYGTKENKSFILSFYYEKINESAWVNYLVYRDLRSRGYVVRGGFGVGIDFRIYERGSYGKNVASTLILSTQEGRPIDIGYLTSVIKQCQSQKKALVLAVMNRRGEIVYYSVSQLTFTK
jgi:tRNA-intron lyase